MPILELCAGYGGLGIAIEALTGDKVAYVAESDEAASLVLAHRFPQAPNIGDITTYDFAQLRGVVDKIAAGFPCQPVSNAGLRLGVLDERWLWPHLARAIRDIRPGHVFLENVAAIKSRGLSVLAEDLAALGYDLWWTTLRASAVGAAHHRDRWFGVAVPADAPGVGWAARRTEPAEQQGAVRRLAGDGGQLPAHADRQSLAVGRLEPARGQLQTAKRGGLATEDPHGPARDERLGTAPREAQEGGARTNP